MRDVAQMGRAVVLTGLSCGDAPIGVTITRAKEVIPLCTGPTPQRACTG